MQEQHEAEHPSPVWGDRSDTTVVAVFGEGQVADAGPAGALSVERLPARRLDDRRFEICCIPFSGGLALGDVVVADDDLRVVAVVQPSGRAAFRVSFEASSPVVRGNVTQDLTSLGCLLEWASPRLLAVGVGEHGRVGDVDDYLAGRELRGDLVYAPVRGS